jgi:hypothetical protein
LDGLALLLRLQLAPRLFASSCKQRCHAHHASQCALNTHSCAAAGFVDIPLHLQNFQDQVLQWLQRRFSISAAQAATLPRVYVYGQHVDDATYPRLYASCDCVVLPTR